MSKPRYLYPFIKDDLVEKIVLVGGPRQVGKTTLALTFLNPGKKSNPAYLNWDVDTDRPLIKSSEFPSTFPLIVLDEIHKYHRWRGLLKGLYDKRVPELKILVTGSARLDYYRKGGDSLFGRFHLYRLHPYSLNEMGGDKGSLQDLLLFGGFPEPLFKKSSRFLRRWQRLRSSLILKDDLRDLERVHEVSAIESLMEMLSMKIGSPLSIKSLQEDLEVSHHSVSRWLRILENLYVSFRIPPFGGLRIRAVKKEQKLYLWDWSVIASPGARFENLVACQLLKFIHFQEDTEGYQMELRYLRDTDKREVDFVVIKEGKPLFAVEVKLQDENLSSSVPYFADRTDIPVFYQVHMGKRDYTPHKKIRVLPFTTFCKLLDMP